MKSQYCVYMTHSDGHKVWIFSSDYEDECQHLIRALNSYVDSANIINSKCDKLVDIDVTPPFVIKRSNGLNEGDFVWFDDFPDEDWSGCGTILSVEQGVVLVKISKMSDLVSDPEIIKFSIDDSNMKSHCGRFIRHNWNCKQPI